jgi:hypothetical protein
MPAALALFARSAIDVDVNSQIGHGELVQYRHRLSHHTLLRAVEELCAYYVYAK